MNSFELKQFEAIFAKQYMEAAKVLRQRINGHKNIKTDTPADGNVARKDNKKQKMENRLVSNILFWSKFSKMVQRMN